MVRQFAYVHKEAAVIQMIIQVYINEIYIYRGKKPLNPGAYGTVRPRTDMYGFRTDLYRIRTVIPNESIFSTVALAPELRMVNIQNMTDQDWFNQLLNKTMTELASQASNFPTGANKKFEAKEVDLEFTQFRNLYNLVQCTPDLSSADCNSCLQAAINDLLIDSSGKQGGRIFLPS